MIGLPSARRCSCPAGRLGRLGSLGLHRRLLASALLLFLITASTLPPLTSGCSSSSAHDEYRVVRKTDSDGKQLVVALGDDARLSCQTNFEWKKCLWKPPRNGVRQLRCEFGRDKVTHYSCPSFPEVHYDKDASHSDSCAIVVRNIQEHHEGNWRCEFEIDDPEEEEKIIIKDKVRLVARGWRYP